MKIVGDHDAQILNDQQVTAKLTARTLNISFVHVLDVKQTLKTSQEAARSGIAASFSLVARGVAGMAWAPMSAFGTVGIIRACFSGATNGWLRETLSLRTPTSDAAIGMDLELMDSPRASKVRKHMDHPLGVICDAKECLSDTEFGGERKHTSWKDVYAFDLQTLSMLDRLPDTNPDYGLQVLMYAQYDFQRKHHTKFQIVSLSLSLAKIMEIYVLWAMGAYYAGLVSALPWLYFFLVALGVEVKEVVLKRRPENEPGHLDIITGKLPRVGQEGGARKVVLGVSENPKRSLEWKIM
ncbi:hypothetical protein M422DRAFT_248096 [Sphaerobolus stellatus SS14]|uniref:Uncharacterized protein n=1 Tax=Sphaerobolus stellatus (strain SS14) TaxID=990650 RepID=A0A0C9VJ04_SPHS4|nr:hypothetical protein M422DRAFT_248096 [Sphaerobolus stellatus SS14]